MRSLLLLVPILLLPVAASAPTETEPGCEPGQPLVGYRSTQPLTDAWEAQQRPGGLWLCEGEHWDGQDTVSPAEPDSCSPSADPDPEAAYVGWCQGADPNARAGDDPLTPVGLRVGASDGAAYAAANVVLVGRVALYADDATVAVYARDNTPGNVVASILSPMRVTQGFMGESDCSQAVYEEGAYNPPTQCGRDNTAITLEHGIAEMLP